MHTGTKRIGNASFVIWIEAFQNGKPVARGKTVSVHFDFANQKSSPLPEHLRAGLAVHLREE